MLTSFIMGLLSILALSCFMVTAVPVAVPVAVRDAWLADLPYPLAPMGFTGSIGGHEVQLNGTAQEIYSQLQALHPDFNATVIARSSPDPFYLATRSKKSVYCIPVAHWGWGFADLYDIVAGIGYLDGLAGCCGVGPRNCVRISCSGNSGIYLCNDNPYSICPSCSYLASYAIDLAHDCTNGGDPYEIGGQEFDTDGYNVIVHSDSC